MTVGTETDIYPDPEQDDEDAREPIFLTVDRICEILSHGELEEQGLLPYSSNYGFLVLVYDDGIKLPAVYKPRQGESPLWDFPTGTLCQRETAAYEVSHALGWNLVPPTVLRQGTRGIGSVQFFIDCDPDLHYFTIREDARFASYFRRMALFDYVINNADRKSGHCLRGYDERIWAIDHGICFHEEYKLRTVIWEFSGETIEEELLDHLASFCNQAETPSSHLRKRLDALLSNKEQSALRTRTERLLQSGQYPSPPPHQRNFPWPPV